MTIEKKITEENWVFVPLFWGTLRIEDLFENITSEVLKNYQSQGFERFEFIFTYAEWDERLLWLCTRSAEVIC
jgi:hypothetical protein